MDWYCACVYSDFVIPMGIATRLEKTSILVSSLTDSVRIRVKPLIVTAVFLFLLLTLVVAIDAVAANVIQVVEKTTARRII